MLANLETLPTDAPPAPCPPAFAHACLRRLSPPSQVSALRALAPTVILSVANNHALDGGLTGLKDAAERLAAARIGVVGEAPLRPQVWTVDGVKVGVLAATLRPPIHRDAVVYWGEPKALTELPKAVAALRPACDLLVVQVHWGREGERRPSGDQRALAAALADAGADLVLGHHPHTPQPVERVGRAVVVYGLGDLGRGTEGRWLRLRFSRERGLELAP